MFILWLIISIYFELSCPINLSYDLPYCSNKTGHGVFSFGIGKTFLKVY